jgi:uncharacterized membrane protein
VTRRVTAGLRQLFQDHPRRTVAAFAVPVLIVKLLLAARTFGTKDMLHWADFTAGVRAAGPVGVYGITFPHSFYNHPPLMGFVLWFINGLQDLGISDNFSIRALAGLCDVGSAFVLLAMLRRRRPLSQATLAAVLLAVSPVLLLVSGFHGNTDPDFVFMTLLGLYLLVDRRLPQFAGMAFAVAIGIKIVPMVVLPAVAVYAWKRGGRTLVLLAAGFLAVFAFTWGPALLSQFAQVKAQVLGYAGIGDSFWGIMQVGHWLGDPGWVAVLEGSGRFGLVLVCALLPAAAVWFRPAGILPAVAWSLLVFLAFATSFGVQYLVWPVAVAFLVNVRWAAAYSFSAGIMLAVIYNQWNGGLPWNYGDPKTPTTGDKVGLVVPWLVLLVLIVQATAAAVRSDPPGRPVQGKLQHFDPRRDFT